MALQLSNDLRDSALTAFRERICEKMEIVPFVHQRAWWAASDGLTLLDVPDVQGASVRLADGSVTKWMTVPREGGRARFLADLGAFKVGKSFGAALWASGFACMPNRRISIVGLEYDICEPEFSYIIEFLLSERGMSIKAKSVTNRPRAGDMFLELENGTRYEARSWERKDSLKGKEIDAYIYAEAYQLPGIECFTGFSQNLRARRGFAVLATTPDRPWVKELHERGHGQPAEGGKPDYEFHCTCSVAAENNPFTFDAKAKVRDESLMTREKFAIHYGGKLGDFVGRVFNFQRGDNQFTIGTHPGLFLPASQGDGDSLHIPDGWEIVGGADTGTFYTALLVAFSPEGDAFVIGEFPNYRYVAGSAERDEDITIPAWTEKLAASTLSRGGRLAFWADPNSQFKREFVQYGITLMPNKHGRETRTEVAREYFQHGRVFLAPWLSVLPFELENACWPEEASAAGKFERIKDRDHTLDCLEHILSRRPRGYSPSTNPAPKKWADQFRPKQTGNTHLGNL